MRKEMVDIVQQLNYDLRNSNIDREDLENLPPEYGPIEIYFEKHRKIIYLKAYDTYAALEQFFYEVKFIEETFV